MSAATNKEFYTAEEYAAAKAVNIAYYLQSTGYALQQEGRDFKGKSHNSLCIREDGRWYWNSRGIGGKSPIELLKQILIHDYGYRDEISAAIEAVKRLAASQGMVSSRQTYCYSDKQPQTTQTKSSERGVVVLPEANKSNSRTMAYLCSTRGLDVDIVKDLMHQKKIYESKDFHNAVFVSYDNEGNPRHAFMRGTLTLADKQFKKEAPNSDKSYAYTLPGHPDSGRIFVFEAAIDAISHASLYKLYENDWKADSRIALGGTSFLGLERFLNEHPQVKQIVVCLDNDPTGQRRGEKLQQEYTEKGYGVTFEYPFSKDYNEDLLNAKSEDEEMGYEP